MNIFKPVIQFIKFLFSKPIPPTQKMEVRGVDDGDTIEAISERGEIFEIRLFGIDAPETEKKWLNQPGQPFGKEAKLFLQKELTKGTTINVIPEAKDQYGRTVATIFIKDESQSLNQRILSSGLAWYDEYGHKMNPSHPRRKDLMVAFQEAKTQKIGLWSQANAEAPYRYRQRMKG